MVFGARIETASGKSGRSKPSLVSRVLLEAVASSASGVAAPAASASGAAALDVLDAVQEMTLFRKVTLRATPGICAIWLDTLALISPLVRRSALGMREKTVMK